MFSKVALRLNGETNALYRMRDEMVRAGATILDMASGNVTEHGIRFPQELLEEIMVEATRSTGVYRPDSFGQLPAREAVSRYYREQGTVLPAGQILLTPGTSLAYWYAFKLLADEGDEILCPRPSYPLFDYIATLSGARLIPYRLDEGRRWAVDLGHLENSISTRTRALVVISPHNPTGRVTTRAEFEALEDLAARHDFAIILDEVFNEFLMKPGFLPRPASGRAPLVLILNGFSKMFALPGIKFGWMGVSGLPARVKEAMRALELISDTFLPVNEIAQAAAPEIMRQGREFRDQYAAEMRRRWEIARMYLDRAGHCRYVSPEGGCYVTVGLQQDEEATAEAILWSTRSLVHPGHFYEIDPHHLVISYALEAELLHLRFPQILREIGRQGTVAESQ